MLEYPAIIAITAFAVLVFLIIIFVFTGSFLAVLVLITIGAILFFVLNMYGYINITTTNGLDINFFEKSPSPSPPKQIVPVLNSAPAISQEVFYVTGNNYTYEDAPAVCAAYGASLATYDQIADAFAAGAEWCGYGWSQGGMALFPTQESTWAQLQSESDTSKRTGCGRPGINGGYFDTNMKFGVNCYGKKPRDPGHTYPIALPGSDDVSKLVNKFKSMLSKMTVGPFNRKEWSQTLSDNI